jgi:hypothetical protein
LVDPDVWYCAETKEDGFEYYAYVLVYIDDIHVISHDASATMQALSNLYCLKDGFSPPMRHLGATIKKWRIFGDEKPNHWGHSLEEYIRQAIANVEKELSYLNHQLSGRISTLMTLGYRPKQYYSRFLADQAVNYYM